MRVRSADAAGFGLIEVIVSFLLLAIIAVVILPVLWNGLANTVRQSDTATALRAGATGG